MSFQDYSKTVIFLRPCTAVCCNDPWHCCCQNATEDRRKDRGRHSTVPRCISDHWPKTSHRDSRVSVRGHSVMHLRYLCGPGAGNSPLILRGSSSSNSFTKSARSYVIAAKESHRYKQAAWRRNLVVCREFVWSGVWMYFNLYYINKIRTIAKMAEWIEGIIDSRRIKRGIIWFCY